jgi:hypothetical protein
MVSLVSGHKFRHWLQLFCHVERLFLPSSSIELPAKIDTRIGESHCSVAINSHKLIVAAASLLELPLLPVARSFQFGGYFLTLVSPIRAMTLLF